MANFTSKTKTDLNKLKLLAVFDQNSSISGQSADSFTVQSNTHPNYTAVFTGSFSYPNPYDLPDGNIETLTLYSSPGPNAGGLTEVFRITDLDLSPKQARQFAADQIFRGNDSISGSELSDALKGFEGNDVLKGAGGNDTVDGGAGKDNVQGGTGKDKVSGGAGNDQLQGDAGQDWLRGGMGNDLLKGGRDKDVFVFDEKLAPNNVDKIGDYEHGRDKMMLDGAAFAVIEKIGLKDHLEILSSKASQARHDQDHDHHAAKPVKDGAKIIYNADSGFLYYDVDGKGGKAPVHFATITDESGHHPTSLSYADFIIG